ncbi:RNA methyltransferase [Patescibacteria group bacterium]|nr:RNA methyltransferase [Patescibacteria group bacterium]
MNSKTISSPQNPIIKQIKKLYKKKERAKQKLFLIEGKREITRAITNSLEITSLIISDKNRSRLNITTNNCTLQSKLFQKITYRQNPTGFLAIFKQPDINIDHIKFRKKPFILIIESPEKPGNVGALLRTADAVGVDSIIITDPNVDLYNPNVIRAACGTFFSRPIFLSDTKNTIKILKTNKIKIIATTPDAKKLYYNFNYNQPIAITAGREDQGLSSKWLKNADYKIKIPMRGIADSLNLSVSTGIILYEAIKQIKYSKNTN